MDVTPIPATVYVAIGAILAAVVTGFFSFVNLVSAKENKVSEFRLAWIDGLRNEIAEYSAGVQELARFKVFRDAHAVRQITELEAHQQWLDQSKDALQQVVKSMSCIQMRLNPKRAEEDPESHEAVLMRLIITARDEFNRGDYGSSQTRCVEIREAAAPLLKSTWETVKRGEIEYQRIRKIAWNSICVGMAFSAMTLALILLLSLR
ncbi:hypothetical protein [Pseudomonas tolaasii]|uniref:hypothetical protein n=1 Tax=Pseudomonas tolaasii TaxID=29442 RepID=UPI002732BF42|nr:hypothetical protein [Pseudomonas tolaasii]WLH49741.1 hypothetical protein PSH62_16735 [Pseudomonas tolaasii]